MVNPSTDVFKYMAGGDEYNIHLAGGMMYYAPNAAIPMDTTGNSSHISKEAFVSTYQSDALEFLFNFLPIVSITTSKNRIINLYSYIANGESEIVSIAGTTTINIGSGGGLDFASDSHSVSNGVMSSYAASSLTTEESIGANLAAGFAAYSGYTGAGLFPSVFGIVAVDLATGKSINTAALGRMTLDTVVSQFASLATSKINTALGITSTTTAMALSVAVGLVATELVEMAIGLDNSFGFGGELVGYDKYGVAQYSSAMSISTAFNNALKSFTDLVGITDYSFNPNMISTNYDKTTITSTTFGVEDGFSLAGGWFSGGGFSDLSVSLGDSLGGSLSMDLSTGQVSYSGKYTNAAFSTDDAFGFGSSGGGNGGGGYDGGVGRDSDGVGGFGGDGTVICTALSKYGVFSKKELAIQYRHTQKNYSQSTYRGYLIWGKYIAHKVEQGKFVSFWKFIMEKRWKYLSSGKSLAGFFANAFVVGLSFIFGLFYKYTK